jgi:signal transduction histidine kinase
VKGEVLIEVEDEGGGVDAAISARIFDPFFTTKEKGIGLGLSIAYRIATQHGGTLSVSRGDKGARFSLTLPSQPASELSGLVIET